MGKEKRTNVKKLRRRIEKLQQKYSRLPRATGDEEDFGGRQDFTTWDELDFHDYLDQTVDRASFTGLESGTTYCYKDWGTGNLFGDFSIKVDFRVISGDWQVISLFSMLQFLYSANEYLSISVHLHTRTLSLAGVIADPYELKTDSVTISWGVTYYLVFERSGNDVSCKIYLDSERTILWTTLEISLGSSIAFRYTEMGWSPSGWGTGSGTGWIENLDMG